MSRELLNQEYLRILQSFPCVNNSVESHDEKINMQFQSFLLLSDKEAHKLYVLYEDFFYTATEIVASMIQQGLRNVDVEATAQILRVAKKEMWDSTIQH